MVPLRNMEDDPDTNSISLDIPGLMSEPTDERRVPPPHETRVEPSVITQRQLDRLSIPDWPWSVLGAAEAAIDRACMEGSGKWPKIGHTSFASFRKRCDTMHLR